MVGTQGGSTLRLPDLLVKGDEDVEQHWFLCQAIYNVKGISPSTKMVNFWTTLWSGGLVLALGRTSATHLLRARTKNRKGKLLQSYCWDLRKRYLLTRPFLIDTYFDVGLWLTHKGIPLFQNLESNNQSKPIHSPALMFSSRFHPKEELVRL